MSPEEGTVKMHRITESLPTIRSEGQRETDDDPEHTHYPKANETLHHSGDNIFVIHQSSVEECEAGGHEHCQGEWS